MLWSGVAIFVLGLALGGTGVQLFRADYTAFQVTTGSMQPTVGPGDDMLFRSGGSLTPHRGDVVLAHQSPPGIQVVRRVIGLPGDTVACCDGQHRITVNGRAVTEDYVHPDPKLPGAPTDLPFNARVPAGRVFLAGDDRANSDDSRLRGPAPISDIRGIAVTGWPVSVPFTPIPATTAFVAAGLPGPATEDTGSLVDIGLALGGAVLALAGLVIALVGALLGGRRIPKPPMSH